MAQIFVAHSSRDQDLVAFFTKAFLNSKVNVVFEEFEKIFGNAINNEKIKADVTNSKALFVILSRNVQDIPQTRDWVVWEAGVGTNRDIWVFEPQSQSGRISVIIPYLRHYVLFDTSDEWMVHVRNIILSYDDSHVLPTVLLGGSAGAGIGAAISEKNRLGGAIVGAIGGVLLSNLVASSSKTQVRPMGLNVQCIACNSTYNIHIPPKVSQFRCPVCNVWLQLMPPDVSVVSP